MSLTWCSIMILVLFTKVTIGDYVNYTELFGPSVRGALNFSKLVDYDGYSSETHTVTTSDGYILTVFRIPLLKTCNASSGVLLFMHGMYLSGDDCIIPGPGGAHCYIYADNCYDVWVPNVRGNRYSRKHLWYDPDTDPRFWNFSVDEMALYDLPSSLDYILNVTGEKRVSYVGFAQGAAMLLMLCSMRPEYNDKIKVGYGMSTTAWLSNARFIAIDIESTVAPLLTTAVALGANSELLPHGKTTQTTANLLCSLSTVSYPFCSVAVFALLGYNKFQITADVLQTVVGHSPAGTSYKNFARWGQIKNNGFTKYDYGVYKNLIEYKSVKPPEYNLTAINMTWVFIASVNDNVGDVQDLDILTQKLVNSNHTVCVLEDTSFGHLDFIYGKDVPNYITPTILKYLESGKVECQ